MSDQTLNYTFRGNDNTVTTKLPVTVKTSNYTVNANDDIARELTFDTTTSDLTVDLPTASSAGNGFNVILRNVGTGILTIDPDGTETIDGELTAEIKSDQVFWINCDGVSWRSIVGNAGESTGAANPNLLINGAFAIWQRGTSFTPNGSSTEYSSDRWAARRGAIAEFTVSRQGSVGEYSSRVQRNSGTSSTKGTSIGQTIESNNVSGLFKDGARLVTISFSAKKGADYSAASDFLATSFRTGTGIDEGFTKMYTGQWTGDGTNSKNHTLTSSFQTFTHTHLVPSGTKELGMYFEAMPLGTAGTNDWYEVDWVKMEVSDVATEFLERPYGEEFALCQRYYQKPSHYERGFQGYTPSGTTNYTQFRFATEMRSSPTVTTTGIDEAFFPSGPPSTQFVVSSGFGVYKVSNASGTGHFDFDWTADAEL